MTPAPHHAHVCLSCPAGQQGLARKVADLLADLPFTVAGTECLSACTRPSTLAFRAPGKTAYLFGDLTEADLPEIRLFATAYLASPDGTFADARPLGQLRHKALARIPG